MKKDVTMFAGVVDHGTPRTDCYCEPCKKARAEQKEELKEALKLSDEEFLARYS